MIPRNCLRLSRPSSAPERHVLRAPLASQRRHLGSRKAPSTRLKQWQQAPAVLTPERQEFLQRKAKLEKAFSEQAEDMTQDRKTAIMGGSQALAIRLSNRIASFIHDFSNSSQTDADFKKYLNRNGVQVHQVYEATFILRNLGPPQMAKLGRFLVRCCDRAGYPEATIQVVSSLLRQDIARPGILRTREAFLAQDRLQELWKKGNLSALVLGGKLAERRGDGDRAISFYEKATEQVIHRSDHPHLYQKSDPVNPQSELSSPWMELGILQLRRGNQRKALEAYMIGISQGDPMAHHMLGRLDFQFSNGEYTLDWLYNTTKAAATGHHRAAYTLAEYYANTRPAPRPQLGLLGSVSLKAPNLFARLGHFFVTALVKPILTMDEQAHVAEFAASVQDPVARLRLADEWLGFSIDRTYLPAHLHRARLCLRKHILPEDNLLAPLDASSTIENPLYSPKDANKNLATVFVVDALVNKGRRDATKEVQFRSLVGVYAEHPDVLEDYEGNLAILLNEARDIADEAGIDITDENRGLLYKHKGDQVLEDA